jgi:hypothetical protein
VSALIATLVLITGCGGGGGGPSRSTNIAEGAFASWLKTHHPGFVGLSVCPSSRGAQDANHGIVCLAEIHKGTRYLHVWATAKLRTTVVFRRVYTESWTRRWSKYARPPQHVSPGVISVNATGFDWRWLVLGVDYKCRTKHRQSCTASALDGQWAGYEPIFVFDCRTLVRVIACRNQFGDAMRWRPLG